ncbi:MAG: hypothetical protein CVT49_16255 [candidate division Zixibacteria bacterium HGW-Zixibacteria-1]|nr:MAG: hypothetical protein CVT49_16255 [candidate division Zixibacteria bacterium HGW-Zixibacteria-1]
MRKNHNNSILSPCPLNRGNFNSFKKVKMIKSSKKSQPLKESIVKEFLKKIIGQKGDFRDWGGEENDLYTSRVIFKGKRHLTAMALKGRATKAPLTPKKMGKNGDQIVRLFYATADLFIVQFWGKVESSIYKEMERMAIAASFFSRKEIFYCIIDGDDTQRLIQAYQSEWKEVNK